MEIIRVERAPDVQPGGATWAVRDGRTIFRVSADAVTCRGASALERAWMSFARSGEWVRGGQSEDGIRVRKSTYFRTGELPHSVPVLVNVPPDGQAMIALGADHFTAEAVDGIQRAVQSCLDENVWHYHPLPLLEGRLRGVGGVDEREGIA